MSKKSDYIIDIKNLNVTFPIFGGIIQHEISAVHAVKNFSIQVKKGETIAIVPSLTPSTVTLSKPL